MNRIFLRAILPTLSLGLISSPVFATSLTAQQILQQFNLVVLDDATSDSDVDGRTYVGGDLTGGIYLQHPNDTPASAYAGLTVQGNTSNVKVTDYGAVVGGNLTNSTINNGNTVVLGTASGDAFNGGGHYYAGTVGSGNSNGTYDPSLLFSAAAIAATSTNFSNVLDDLSNQLQSIGSTGSSITVTGAKVTFNASVDANGLAVFTITDSSIFETKIDEYAFNLNEATTVIINSDATTVNIDANFLGGSAPDFGSKILWNFYNATSVTLATQFGGSLLATDAMLTNYNNIEGGVYVDTLNQKGEIHLQSFTGTIPSVPVPEPSTMLLFGTGFMSLIAICRKK